MQKSGSITLNGITTSELIEILKLYEQNDLLIEVNPKQMEAVHIMEGDETTKMVYNNVNLTWSDEPGLKIVSEIIRDFLPLD